MKKSTVERDAADAMRGGRGLSRLLVWAGLLVLILLALLQFGCQSLHISDAEAQALFDRAVTRIRERLAEDPTPLPDTPTADASKDAVDYSLLQWSHGGFNGAGAMLHPETTIGSLSITSSGMSYRWVAGGCEQLGASNRGDYNSTLACLFYKDPSGQWRGGKFDWISTSRTTRDFKNIHTGYVGWDSAACFAATDYAFVIVSVRNGTRTNVITTRR